MDATVTIRAYAPADREPVNALVLAAWQELALVMPDFASLAPRLTSLTEKAADSEVIVAELDGQLAGAVAYVSAARPRPDFFDPAWPMVRLMSVLPSARGHGIGERLLDECLVRARRDGAPCLALHTTLKMAAAQRLYLRAGFEKVRDLPPQYGVPYVLMNKRL
jgi:GNAT superfamily N-acetyltransferase